MELCENCLEEFQKLEPVDGRFLVCHECALTLAVAWWDR